MRKDIHKYAEINLTKQMFKRGKVLPKKKKIEYFAEILSLRFFFFFALINPTLIGENKLFSLINTTLIRKKKL